MQNIFHALSQAESALSTVRELQGRSVSLGLGVITNTQDPEQQGRVQVRMSAHGGKSLSPWYWRMMTLDSMYPPEYLVGRTAVVGYVDGDPNTGVVLGVLLNQQNRMTQYAGDQLNYFIGETQVTLDPEDGVTIVVGNTLTLKVTRSTVTINDKDVATLGAKDTDNDTLITKGYSA